MSDDFNITVTRDRLNQQREKFKAPRVRPTSTTKAEERAFIPTGVSDSQDPLGVSPDHRVEATLDDLAILNETAQVAGIKDAGEAPEKKAEYNLQDLLHPQESETEPPSRQTLQQRKQRLELVEVFPNWTAYMTALQLYCTGIYPSKQISAILYKRMGCQLTDQVLDLIAKRFKWDEIRTAHDRMTGETLDRFKRTMRDIATRHLIEDAVRDAAVMSQIKPPESDWADLQRYAAIKDKTQKRIERVFGTDKKDEQGVNVNLNISSDLRLKPFNDA